MSVAAKERNTQDCALAGPKGWWGPGRKGESKVLHRTGGHPLPIFPEKEKNGPRACLLELLMEVGD